MGESAMPSHRRSSCPILALLLVSAARADDVTAGGLASSVESFVQKQELAGAVMLVASREKVLAADAVGFADIARQKKMTPDAIFWIASQSKPITAAALMMLVDDGKLSLDDPIE